MTQKIQQLQQAIREVCKELKGCGDNNCHEGHYPMGYNEETDEVDWGGCPVCIVNGEYTPPIKDIELQHILRAMQGDMNRFDSEYAFYIRELILRYNLTLPLDQQSPEVIDFLHSIICKG